MADLDGLLHALEERASTARTIFMLLDSDADGLVAVEQVSPAYMAPFWPFAAAAAVSLARLGPPWQPVDGRCPPAPGGHAALIRSIPRHLCRPHPVGPPSGPLAHQRHPKLLLAGRLTAPPFLAAARSWVPC